MHRADADHGAPGWFKGEGLGSRVLGLGFRVLVSLIGKGFAGLRGLGLAERISGFQGLRVVSQGCTGYKGFQDSGFGAFGLKVDGLGLRFFRVSDFGCVFKVCICVLGFRVCQGVEGSRALKGCV